MLHVNVENHDYELTLNAKVNVFSMIFYNYLRLVQSLVHRKIEKSVGHQLNQ